MASGRAVNQGELAVIFGVDRHTVADWVRAGCPYVSRGQRGREWTFDTAAVAAWREQRALENVLRGLNDVESKELRRRRLAAEAGMAEMTFVQRRAELIEAREAFEVVAREYQHVRTRLLTLPGALAKHLGDAHTIAQRKTMIHDAICHALGELSAGGEDTPHGNGSGQ